MVRVGVVGVDADRRAVRRLRLGGPPLRAQHHAEVVVRVRVLRVERDRPLGTRRPPRRAAGSPAGRCRGCCASRPGRARARGCARSARQPRRRGLAVARARPSSAARRHARARARGCSGRSPRPPRAARPAGARSRPRAPRRGSAPGRQRGSPPYDYPDLFDLRSYLKCRPAASDPSGFCGLYSRSTFANDSVTVSA